MKTSVIIATHNPGAVIGDCLDALRAQAGGTDMEIIVADSSTDGTADKVEERFPEVRLLRFNEPMTIPYLRGAGMAAATGDVIAILDPYCIVEEEWVQRVARVHQERPELVIGGTVDLEQPDHQGLVQWATYLCEYDAFMPPVVEGPAAELTGNNLAYKREALGDVEALPGTGFWKTFFNHELRMRGHRLWCDPGLRVRLRKHVGFRDFLGSRYHHGRCFGGMRFADAPGLVRWARAATTPALPFLALWRQGRRLWAKGHRRATFLKAAPLLFLFHAMWAWGELFGYLRGPGQSCSRLHY